MAPTPPGLTVTVQSTIDAMDDRTIWFRVRLRDDTEVISEGRHQRAIVQWDRFQARVDAKKMSQTAEAR